MDFFLLINNTIKLTNLDNHNTIFLRWLDDHASKWIIKNKDTEILCIASTKDYSNLSHISYSIINYYIKWHYKLIMNLLVI